MDAKDIFEIAAERYAICRECPLFNKATRQCMDCGCLMPLKTKVPASECPQGKWGQHDIAVDEFTQPINPNVEVVSRPTE